MERTLIESYSLIAESVPATINIWQVPGELIPHYELIVPEVDMGTLAVLDEIKEELARTLTITIEEITDPQHAHELRTKVLDVTNSLLQKKFPSMDHLQRTVISGMLMQKVYGIGELETLLADAFLEEIVINGSKQPISVYHKKFGWMITNKNVNSEEDIYNLAAQIGRRIGRQITLLTPIMDAHLVAGDRVAATLFPISTAGSTITIRKFARVPWNIVTLIKNKTTSIDILAFVWLAIQYERSVMVAGATASGKTSMLNALCVFIPPSQRVITIEDTREILLPKALHWNWVPMNSRSANAEGQGEVTMLDLIVASLRMRPDRIIIGEVRRREQAETMFEAMNTGHSVYSTIHADNVEQVKRRLLEPPISIPKNEVESLPLILIQYRDMRRNLRRTLELAEVLQNPKPTLLTNYLFRWHPRNDTFEPINQSQRIFEDLNLHTGLTIQEIKQDLKEKESILQWMANHNVTDLDLIGSVMKAYYFNKEIILRLVNANKSPGAVLDTFV
ncbi:MAG: type II/IV secretion system ATPase subunit [Nanoarchaeota archaeon]